MRTRPVDRREGSAPFAGRVALVTGGSRGIGRAVATDLSSQGAKVVIASRKADELERTAAELGDNVSWVVANAGDSIAAEAAVGYCISTYGRLDVLINNAATNPYFGPLMGLGASQAAKTAQINQWAPVEWTRLAWDGFMASSGGVVVNVASIGGLITEPNIAYYNATKAALLHLTRHLAAELAPLVRVNAVAPGLVKTDMSHALWADREAEEASRLPLGRLGEPSDIAQAVSFLASESASWITGQVLVVDGGATITPPGDAPQESD